MDIVISVVVVLLLVGTILVLFTGFSEKTEPRSIYGGIVFTNIEKLQNDNIAFLNNQIVDESKLAMFSSQSYSDIKNIILAGSDFSGGDDVCIFFLNRSNAMTIGGSTQVGHGSCSFTDPCRDYIQSFIFTKPVLKESEIVNMYIAVCEPKV